MTAYNINEKKVASNLHFRNLALNSAILADGVARFFLISSTIFPNSYATSGIRTQASIIAPDWDLRRTLYRLSYTAAGSFNFEVV